jgi:DNA polymerase III sliding clamp (beta) subunit (PCNA family)
MGRTGEKVKIIIPAESLLKLKPFVSDEQTRLYLNGVCIQKHPKSGVLLIATDGHRLGVWQETNCSVEGTWPTDSLIVGMDNKLSALLKRKGEELETTYAIVDTDQNTVSIGYGPSSLDNGIPEPDLTQHKALISGTFPDWQNLIPPLGALKPFPYNETSGFRPNILGTSNQ